MINKKKLFGSLFFNSILFAAIMFTANAQEDYLFENISVADGLSSSSFNPFENIYQDKFGFLWFGTTDGLNRYDGYKFKVYKNIPGDSTSLPSSNIQTITEDTEGNLWVGTAGVMSRLDRKTDNFSHFPLDQGSTTIQQDIPIFRSLIDSKNNFWITTQRRSVQKWNEQKQQWELIPFLIEVDGVDTLVRREINSTFAIKELKNGNLLVSDFVEGIFYYNESSNVFEEFKFAGNAVPPGIIEIFEDRGGKIWLAGQDSFIEYNPKSFTFEFKDDLKRFLSSGANSFFFNINEREDGTFLLCSIPNGLMKFDPSNEKFEVLKIGGELEQRGVGKFAANKFIDKFGVYWIGLIDNGILKFDPNRKPFRFYSFDKETPSQSYRGITGDIKVNNYDPNEIIIATDRRGFYKLDLADKSIDPMKVSAPSIYSDSSNLRNFVIGDDKKLWFPGTSKDISSYDLNSGKVETFRVIDPNIRTGGQERIRHVEYLPKNKLVVSTSIGGFIFDTNSKTFENLPSTMNRKYNEKFFTEVKKLASDNKPYLAITGVGEAADLSENFTLSSEMSFLIICLGEGNHPNGIFDFGSIKKNDGTVVWSMNEIKKTFHGGGGYKNRLKIDVITLPPGNYSANYITDVGHSYNNFNVKPPENPEWYGIQLLELDKSQADNFKLKIKEEEAANNYPDFYEVSFTLSSRKYPSDLWIGADENGIIRYDLTTKKFNQYNIADHAAAIFETGLLFEDSKGRLWITINPSGFYRFIPETGEFISNTNIPDLPITGINGIIEDFQGSIWVSSSGGITKLSEQKDGSWSTSNYDTKDGVPGGFGGGTLITRDGEIYFGSFNGVTAFYPSTENTSPPIPIISNIIVSDVSIFNKESKLNFKESIYKTSHFNLSFDQNDLSFEFASLHYSRPSKNRVSYNLEGFSDHWNFTDKNFASFTNLEPGDYTLKIKAYSGFGVPSKYERNLSFTIAPPWYRTTAAYISYGLLLIGLIFTVDRVQRRRLLTKERERQKIQEAELRAIAAEAQAKAAEAENERKSRELEEARELQLSMLPKKLPELPNLDIAVYMKTATEVGGDYYDFHVSMDGTLTVVVGDATGHGMKAGTMVTAAKSLFSTHASNPDILFTFREISRCIKHMDMHLLTMCMTVLKINQNRMILSSAGMPPTLLFRESTKQLEEIVVKGMPLGAFENFPYSLNETELYSGDTLLLMSDGFPELFNNEKEMYGYERAQEDFHKVARRSPEEIIERLKNNASEWVGNSDPDDDVTFVVVKVK